MKIVVCIKQVPFIEQLKFDHESKRLIREGVESEINPFDKRALTEAINVVKKFGGETIVLTMGPPPAASALREALAMGADRAVHLLGGGFAGADTLATARALALAIRQIGFDLVLCGKYATDAETAQVPPMLAELLNVPQVTGLTRLEWQQSGNQSPRSFLATRELDDGFETLAGKLPALMSAAERLTKPLKVAPPDLERVKDAPIENIAPDALASDVSQFGLAGSPTWVEAIESVESPRKRIIRIADSKIEQAVRDTVDDLVREGLLGDWQLTTHETIHPGPVRNNPLKAFWTVAEVIEGAIRPVVFELLGKSVQLAEQTGGEVGVLLIGGEVRRHVNALVAHGADRVYLEESPALTHYLTETHTEIAFQAIATYKPFAVLFPSTANGRDLAPRVAGRLNVGLTGDVIGLDLDADGRLVQLKPAFGGNIVAPILSRTLPVMATVRPGMLHKSDADQTRSAPVVELAVSDPASRLQWVSGETSTDEGLHLDDAEIVIGVGMGVGGAENLPLVEDLCRELDAHLGATRRVVDAGWLPRQLQIGLTGRTVAPHLYIGLGVRGGFNHMVGVQRSGIILAINREPNADIFQHCDYGIVGDWQAVTQALIRVLREVKASGSVPNV